MKTVVIDASIAIKWVIEEDGTPEALALRRKARLIAPDLLVAECANILLKKAVRNELSKEEADLAARLLQGAEIELLPMHPLWSKATNLAIELDHPAYDCIYLALAIQNDCQFVTADNQLLRKLDRSRQPSLRSRAIALAKAAA